MILVIADNKVPDKRKGCFGLVQRYLMACLQDMVIRKSSLSLLSFSDILRKD